ncbi:hypothetical protein [Sphingomonas melonis]|uniref:hypothetical protein n=1 Tax=Sphingomonas melonis TaxID=152682 RepID=UPI000371429D|nr:hypothetical protein [Sphingomonas melonis]
MQPRFDRRQLAWVAGHLHHQRVVGYPDLIAAGTLKLHVARNALRISCAIATDWWLIAMVQPHQPWLDDPAQGGSTADERRDTLAAFARHARAAAQAAPYDDLLGEIADAVDVLIASEDVHPSPRFLADMTIELRDRAAADRARTVPSATLWRAAA